MVVSRSSKGRRFSSTSWGLSTFHDSFSVCFAFPAPRERTEPTSRTDESSQLEGTCDDPLFRNRWPEREACEAQVAHGKDLRSP